MPSLDEPAHRLARRLRRAVRCSACSRACGCRRWCSRSSPGSSSGRRVLGWVEVDQAVAVDRAARARVPAVPRRARDRLRRSCAGRCCGSPLLGFALSFALARRRRRSALKARRASSTRRCWSRSSSARPRSACSSRCSRTPGEIASTFGQLIIAAGVDRRLRRDHPAVDLLLRRGRDRLDAAADRLRCSRSPASSSSSSAAPSARRAIRADLLRLQDTTAQIRVRAALVLLVGFAAIAEQLGLEAILGAFIAGAILSLARPRPGDDPPASSAASSRRSASASSSRSSSSTSGVRFDLDALLGVAPRTSLMVPIFLAALLRRRAACRRSLYRRVLDARARPRSPG